MRTERPPFTAPRTATGSAPANTSGLFDAFGPPGADEVEVRTWTGAVEDCCRPGRAGTSGAPLVGGAAG